MAQKNVYIPEDYRDFVSDVVSSGHYRDKGEVVAAGLRLLAEQEKENQIKLKALKGEVEKGRASYENGDFVDVTNPNERKRVIREIFDKS